MRIENLQFDDTKLRVEIRDCNETFANMIKRSLTDVQVPACTHIVFKKNTSAFCDEVIAHRIGMLPLRSISPNHRLSHIRAKGPCVVRSSDIKFEDVVCPHKDLLVVVLDKDEELQADLQVELDIGKHHARHSAVVAPRCIRRHVGMIGSPSLHDDVVAECFCEDTEWGTRCKECAGLKRPYLMKWAELVFIVEFETTGSLEPLELLRRALFHALTTCEHVERCLNECN